MPRFRMIEPTKLRRIGELAGARRDIRKVETHPKNAMRAVIVKTDA